MTGDEAARCPLGHRCESCGNTGPALAVAVMPVLGEQLCLTLCRKCRASGRLPQILVSTAVKLVEQHAEHVRPVVPRLRLRAGGIE